MLVRGSNHRFVLGSLGPESTSLLSWVTSHLFLEKVTSQSWSQNLAMDMSEWDARSGRMWASLEAVGSCGRSRAHVWVDCMLLPSGSCTLMGVVVGCGL